MCGFSHSTGYIACFMQENTAKAQTARSPVNGARRQFSRPQEPAINGRPKTAARKAPWNGAGGICCAPPREIGIACLGSLVPENLAAHDESISLTCASSAVPMISASRLGSRLFQPFPGFAVAVYSERHLRLWLLGTIFHTLRDKSWAPIVDRGLSTMFSQKRRWDWRFCALAGIWSRSQ